MERTAELEGIVVERTAELEGIEVERTAEVEGNFVVEGTAGIVKS